MKALLEYLPPESNESFFAKSFDLPYFGTPWHYHPEYELVYIAGSHGKRFIGSAVSDFKTGDLALLGPNLPHIYKNPEAYYQNRKELKAQSIIIHFLEDSLGNDFLKLPQSKNIKMLFEKSTQGIDFYGKTKKIIIQMLGELLRERGMKRLIILIEILHILSESSEYELISAPGITGQNSQDSERMDKVLNYVFSKFQEEISLDDVATIACMTKTSFCRFFKERTKRTFSDFLIDFRLNHASKLLIESEMSILQISQEAGYSNVSNFNRQFRIKYGTTPREYKKSFL